MILDFVQNKTWAAWPWWAIPPIMWWAGTTTVTGVTDTTAIYAGERLNDWWSPITATWFVRYITWNPTYTIGSPWVTNIPDAVLGNPISANDTWLTWWTWYCIRAYATNSVWTSYWPQVCFTTAAYIYVSNANSPWSISKINTSTNTIASTITTWNGSQVIKYSWWYLYVLNNYTNTVNKVDLVTETVIATITVWFSPSDIVFTWSFAYIANQWSWTVTKINTTTNAVVTTIAGTSAARWLTLVGTALYVTQLNALWTINIIDTTTDTISWTITWVWSNTSKIVNDGTYLYVSRFVNPWQIVKIDISTWLVVWTVTTWNSAESMALDWTTLYALARTWNSLHKIDTAAMTISSSYAVTNPTDIQLKSWFAYVVENGSLAVRKIAIPWLTLSNTYTTATWWYGVYIP